METMRRMRIHPLMAGAAVAVIIASAVGVAAMTGHLPGSNAAPAGAQQMAAVPPTSPATSPAVAPPRAVAPSPAAAPPPAVAQAAPACANCGVVASINAYQQTPKNSPVGMIGGALVGGVVGNQIGHGTANTIATVGGAAGGAYVGNEVGKRVQTKTAYKVVVRMDSGATRTFTYAAQPGFGVGSPVRVENGTLVQG